MSNIDLQELIDRFGIPISQVQIDGNKVYIGTVGTCFKRGSDLVEANFDWKKIFELNKNKLVQLVNDMYGSHGDELIITPKPNRVLDLKFKGKEMGLPTVQYSYKSNGDWTLERFHDLPS